MIVSFVEQVSLMAEDAGIKIESGALNADVKEMDVFHNRFLEIPESDEKESQTTFLKLSELQTFIPKVRLRFFLSNLCKIFFDKKVISELDHIIFPCV